MPESLDAELDALFQLPPYDMVEARNALAARLKTSGEREASAQIKALKRPAPAAWAINQVFFRERALLESAREQVARVRALQATNGVDRQQLTAAGDAQRTALQAIVDAALRYCAAAGLPTGPAQERKVFTTVQGWLGGNGHEVPGRMTQELEPSGFETIGVLGMPAPLPAAAACAPAPLSAAPVHKAAPAVLRAAPTVVDNSDALARRARERAEARVLEHKQSLEWAQERVAQQRKKQAYAEHELERAKLEVEDAQRALAERRARMAEREAELASKLAEAAEAERARHAAEEALTQARAELAKLTAERS